MAGLPSGGGGALGQATVTASVWEVRVGLLELGQVDRGGDGPGAVSRARMWGWVEGGWHRGAAALTDGCDRAHGLCVPHLPWRTHLGNRGWAS